MKPEAPIVGTGLEARAARDSGAVVIAEEDGVVEYVDGFKIVISPKDNRLKKQTYTSEEVHAFQCRHMHQPDSRFAMLAIRSKQEMSLQTVLRPKRRNRSWRNVLVAFMPWYGYNFEDAIIISEKLLREDYYTSIYIEEFELTARDTKLGKEEITRDIPNVSEEALVNLGDDGIIRIGAEVKPGDILVGKITPKSETELAPEERLLRAIFGEKAADVKDASLTAPPGTEGVVMDVKVFSRRDRLSKTDDELVEEATRLKISSGNTRQSKPNCAWKRMKDSALCC